MSQIEQLRKQFNGYDNVQKKQFIDNLKIKLHGKNNPEYSRFLQECINKYNVSLRGGGSLNDDFSDLLDSRNVKEASKYTIAEPSQRLVAYFLDVLLILIIIGIWFLMAGGAGVLAFAAPSLENLAIFLTMISVPMVIIIYCVIEFRYWKTGTSWGKKIMKITVVHKDTGKPIGTGNMFLRETFGRMISGMILSLGYIWILIDKDKQAWHDKLVSSVVVKTKG